MVSMAHLLILITVFGIVKMRNRGRTQEGGRKPDAVDTNQKVGVSCVTDIPTDNYLSRVADKINIVSRNFSTMRTDDKFFEKDIPLLQIGKMKLEDGKIATIWSFEPNNVFEGLKQKAKVHDIDSFFAVDVPACGESHLEGFTTYIFSKKPLKEDIRIAREICKVEQQIEKGELPQTIHCDECKSLLHWTEIEDHAEPKSVVEFSQGFYMRVRALRSRDATCKCCSNKVEQTISPKNAPLQADNQGTQAMEND